MRYSKLDEKRLTQSKAALTSQSLTCFKDISNKQRLIQTGLKMPEAKSEPVIIHAWRGELLTEGVMGIVEQEACLICWRIMWEGGIHLDADFCHSHTWRGELLTEGVMGIVAVVA